MKEHLERISRIRQIQTDRDANNVKHKSGTWGMQDRYLEVAPDPILVKGKPVLPLRVPIYERRKPHR